MHSVQTFFLPFHTQIFDTFQIVDILKASKQGYAHLMYKRIGEIRMYIMG